MMHATWILALALSSPTSLPDSTQEEAKPERVREILAAHCVACHHPESEDSRAKRAWGDARDLAATAANEDLVTAGDASFSPLHYLIADGDMPPEDSDVDPVAPEDLAVIANWIEAGMPLGAGAEDPNASQGASASTSGSETSAADQSSVSTGSRETRSALLVFVGRMHPSLVHFPIALLLIAPLAELLARFLREEKLRTAATFSLACGALGSIAATGAGWMLAFETSSKDDLELHRWLGVGTTALAVIALVWILRRPSARLPLMLLLALLVAFAGHIGGEMSWGEGWLAFPPK